MCMLFLVQIKVLWELVQMRGCYRNLEKLFVLRFPKWLFMIQDRWKVFAWKNFTLFQNFCVWAHFLLTKDTSRTPFLSVERASVEKRVCGWIGHGTCFLDYNPLARVEIHCFEHQCWFVRSRGFSRYQWVHKGGWRRAQNALSGDGIFHQEFACYWRLSNVTPLM